VIIVDLINKSNVNCDIRVSNHVFSSLVHLT